MTNNRRGRLRLVDPDDPNWVAATRETPAADPSLSDLDEARHSEVSMMHPLEIPIPRDLLIRLTETALARLRTNRNVTRESPDERSHFAALIQQRLDFLEYLRRQPDAELMTSLYPTADDAGLLFEDGDDLLLDDDLPI